MNRLPNSEYKYLRSLEKTTRLRNKLSKDGWILIFDSEFSYEKLVYEHNDKPYVIKLWKRLSAGTELQVWNRTPGKFRPWLARIYGGKYSNGTYTWHVQEKLKDIALSSWYSHHLAKKIGLSSDAGRQQGRRKGSNRIVFYDYSDPTRSNNKLIINI